MDARGTANLADPRAASKTSGGVALIKRASSVKLPRRKHLEPDPVNLFHFRASFRWERGIFFFWLVAFERGRKFLEAWRRNETPRRFSSNVYTAGRTMIELVNVASRSFNEAD